MVYLGIDSKKISAGVIRHIWVLIWSWRCCAATRPYLWQSPSSTGITGNFYTALQSSQETVATLPGDWRILYATWRPIYITFSSCFQGDASHHRTKCWSGLYNPFVKNAHRYRNKGSWRIRRNSGTARVAESKGPAPQFAHVRGKCFKCGKVGHQRRHSLQETEVYRKGAAISGRLPRLPQFQKTSWQPKYTKRLCGWTAFPCTLKTPDHKSA